MIGYQFNDGGRAASGRKGSAGDCVVRALAIVTGSSYDATYRRVANACKDAGGRRSARNGVPQHVADRCLADAGLRRLRLPAGFSHDLASSASVVGMACVLGNRHHYAAVVGGVLFDVTDSRTMQVTDIWIRPAPWSRCG